MFIRRRRKSLREEVLSSKTRNNYKNIIDEVVLPSELAIQNVQLNEKDKEKASFLSSPHSVKGSFLRNKLDNPLFQRKSLLSRTLSGKLSRTGRSKLKKVKIINDEREEEEEEEEDTDDSDSSDGEENENFSSPNSKSTASSTRSRILNLTLSRKSNSPRRKQKKAATPSRRRLNFSDRLPNPSFLSRMTLGSVRKNSRNQTSRTLKKLNNVSVSSHDSNVNSDSNNSLSESEAEVDLLTKYEERSNEIKNKENAYLLYTANGHPVEVSFNHDYLQINSKICFYEDLASWTHDRKCLRLLYVKNRDTAEQERAEIKLFVADKEYGGKTTPADLTDLLRQRIAVLLADKSGYSYDEALEMTKKIATEKEIRQVVEQIDLSSERCLAESYTKDL